MTEDYSFDAQMLNQMRRLKAILPCCPNCEHFTVRFVAASVTHDGYPTTEHEACELDPAHGRPPARVIAFGCPAYLPGVPF